MAESSDLDEECLNYLRITRLLICEGTSVLIKLFDVYCPPTIDCSTVLNTPSPHTLLKEKGPPPPNVPPSREKCFDFDITLIFTLLKEKCNILPPQTGWNALPNDDDLSLSADVVRIKCYRNKLYSHGNEKAAKLTDEEFNCSSKEIVSSLTRIVRDYSGTDKEAVAAWEKSVRENLTSPITDEDERNVEKLKDWYLKDVEVEQLQSSETEQSGDAIKEGNDTRFDIGEETEEKQHYYRSKGDLKDVEEQLQSSETERSGDAIKEGNDTRFDIGEETEEKQHYDRSKDDLKDVEEQLQSSETERSGDAIKEGNDTRFDIGEETEEKQHYDRSKGDLKDVEEQLPSSETEQSGDAIKVVKPRRFEEEQGYEHSAISIGIWLWPSLVKELCHCGHFLYIPISYDLKVIAEKLHDASKNYYYYTGFKAANSGDFIGAVTMFHHVLKSSPPDETLLRASLENNIACCYFFGKNDVTAIRTLKNTIRKMNCENPVTLETDNFTDIVNIKFILNNNYACMELQNGNFEEALSIFRNLYEEGKRNTARQSSVTQQNLVNVVINYSEACLLSGNLGNIVEALQHVIHGSEIEYQLHLVVSVRLARILTLQGKRKQAGELIDPRDIDSLKIQKIIESDSLKPFSVIYTEDICRILTYNEERSKSKELLHTAIRACQEMHFKEHPLVMSLEKTKEELFPTLVIEKASLALEEDDISRLKVVTNVCVEYAFQVLQNECDSESLLRELNTLRSMSDEKSFADMNASEKQLVLSTQTPAVAFISTLCICAFLSRQVKSNKKAKTCIQNQLAKIESLCDDVKENALSKSVISFLSDYRSCHLAALCSLLEMALLRHAHTSLDDICTSLVSYLSRRKDEDDNESECYKDYCGLLSYFVATNHVQISGKEITLYVIVTSGSGLKSPEELGCIPEKKPVFSKSLFKKIILHADESEECSSRTHNANSKCFVFLKSRDLIDIKHLRRINKTITESAQSLGSLQTNASYQGSLFIEVMPEIDPANVSGLCLQLNLLKYCLEGSDAVGSVNETSVQNWYVQKLQKPLAFANESDLDVFLALFQYTLTNLKIVDVLQKTRKNMVCVWKEHPFSLLTLHTKANTVYLTLQDVSDNCFSDGTVANTAAQITDEVIDDCFNKLCISSIKDSKSAWGRLSDEKIDENAIFFAEEEDALEKACKTNARVTAQLEYLQEKTQKLSTRIRMLLDQLSEMEARASLLQDHFVQTICSDEERARAAENWFAKTRRRAEPQEGPSNYEDNKLEETLKSLSNDDLAEILAEFQRPDLVSVLMKDQTNDQPWEMSFDKDNKGAGCRIVEEETIGKSFNQELNNHDVEGKDSSDMRSWYFPLPESRQDFCSTNNAVGGKELPILREECTQTDSLSLAQEYRDMNVQTDTAQLTNEESLREKGLADFERDRAERQLRKSRLSNYVIAFKNHPREHGSSQDSIVTETSGFSSQGTYWDLIPPGSLPLKSLSRSSIISGSSSSHGTEDVSLEGTPRDSITPCFISEQSGSESHSKEDVSIEGTPRDSITPCFISEPSGSASHSTEDVSIEGIERASITSGFISERLPSRCSIVSEESSHGTEDVSIEGTPQDTITPGFISEQSGSANHGTEDVSIEGTARDSISTGVMCKHFTRRIKAETSGNDQSLGDSSFVISSTKQTDRVAPKKEVPYSTFSNAKIWLDNARESGNTHFEKEDDCMLHKKRCLDTAKESGYNKPVTNENRVPILLTEKLDIRNQKEQNEGYLDVEDGRLEIQETRNNPSAYYYGHSKSSCVGISSTSPWKGRSRSSNRVSHDNERTKSAEYVVESDGDESFVVEGKITFNEKETWVSSSDVTLKMSDDVTARRAVCSEEVRPQITSNAIKFADTELAIASSTAASAASLPVITNFGSSCAKPHKHESRAECIKSEDISQKVFTSQEGSLRFTCNERSNATGSTTSEDAASDDKNVSETVSSFGHGDYMSLPTRVRYEVNMPSKVVDERSEDPRTRSTSSAYCDRIRNKRDVTGSDDDTSNKIGCGNENEQVVCKGEIRTHDVSKVIDEACSAELKSDRIHPLLSSQQDNRDRECLSIIKETEDMDIDWISQGARPKTIGLQSLQDDYIVSGVDSSFLARHSNDSSLTRSVYSRTQVTNNPIPFLSLPVCSNTKAGVTSLAKTWPICDERLLPDQDNSTSFSEKPKLPYQGLPCGTQKEPVVTSDTDIYSSEEQTKKENSRTISRISHSSDFGTTKSERAEGKDSNKCDLLLQGKGIADASASDGGYDDDGHGHGHGFGDVGNVGDGDDVDEAIGNADTGGDDQMKQQSQVVFNSIHEVRSPNTFGLPPLLNSKHLDENIDLPQTQDSSSVSGSYETADNSLESLESLEHHINRSMMTWSQMSENMLDDDGDEEHLDEELESENQEEPERGILLAASSEGNEEENKNRNETEGKCEVGKNKNSMESRGSLVRLFNWAKKLGRKERETREADAEKGDTFHSQRKEVNTQAAEQMTSLPAQRVSADICDARERELRIARERERKQKLEKELEEINKRLEESQKEKAQSATSSPQPARLPVQESINEWACDHYKRKCEIKFPCCKDFYPCHRCHNNSDNCEKDDMKALHGTHLRCSVCLTEQEITENSHHCINCNTQLSEYFCGICKHFTGNEKTPYHCSPCGICRIHRDRSFHCDVCKVCLDERLRNNHKCRPDSGHDECCICLEDAFGGCQILPCSHKVHRECAIAMLKNGVRKCPVCRHPLNLPFQR